jgi:hypothetical protein
MLTVADIEDGTLRLATDAVSSIFTSLTALLHYIMM